MNQRARYPRTSHNAGEPRLSSWRIQSFGCAPSQSSAAPRRFSLYRKSSFAHCPAHRSGWAVRYGRGSLGSGPLREAAALSARSARGRGLTAVRASSALGASILGRRVGGSGAEATQMLALAGERSAACHWSGGALRRSSASAASGDDTGSSTAAVSRSGLPSEALSSCGSRGRSVRGAVLLWPSPSTVLAACCRVSVARTLVGFIPSSR